MHFASFLIFHKFDLLQNLLVLQPFHVDDEEVLVSGEENGADGRVYVREFVCVILGCYYHILPPIFLICFNQLCLFLTEYLLVDFPLQGCLFPLAVGN